MINMKTYLTYHCAYVSEMPGFVAFADSQSVGVKRFTRVTKLALIRRPKPTFGQSKIVESENKNDED